MFRLKGNKNYDPDNVYDRRRGLSRNRNLCMIACGLLVYQVFTAYMEYKSEVPFWFVFIMAAMTGVTVWLIYRNGKMLKALDEEIAELEAAELEAQVRADDDLDMIADDDLLLDEDDLDSDADDFDLDDDDYDTDDDDFFEELGDE